MRSEFILLVVLMVGFVSAGVQICIDLDAPSAPIDLGVSGSVGSILLAWGEAIDEPSCSGIDEYVISRGGVEIGRVDGNVLNFIDNANLGNGEYTYTVYAVDLVGHNTGSAIKNVISIGGGGGSSGGGSSYSYICTENWTCENWTECVGDDMRRLCSDLNECGTIDDKPAVYQECGESSGGDMTINSSLSGGDAGETDGGFFSAITGAVIGGGAGWTIAIVFVVLIGGGFVMVRMRRKKKLKK